MLLTRRVVLGAAGTLPLLRVARGSTAHRLTVLHVNDFHSRHEPVDARAMTCLTLTCADLEAAAVHGVSMAGRGGFAQWAGLRMRLLPPGIEVEHPDGTWAPLDRTALYLVATNNFVRNSGDGYAVLRDHAIDPYDTGPSVAGLVANALGRGAAQQETR